MPIRSVEPDLRDADGPFGTGCHYDPYGLAPQRGSCRMNDIEPVGLCLVQFDDPLLAILKTGTMLAQFILNFSLRQNKSGGRFFALRSVDMFNLLGFGGDVGIEEA